MNILIAPNAFKHALSAEKAALAIQKGLMQSELNCSCSCFPVGDGGDGTGELIIKKTAGKTIECKVHNPLGKEIDANYGLIDDGKTAVIEMANASGLRLLKKDELNPLQANSFGTGEQMMLAINKGVNKIILAMGGSATVDGGIGILSALGIRFLNKNGEELQPHPGLLSQLNDVDTSALDERVARTEIVVLCDVDTNLLGEQGAAAVFGPQKGASSNDIVLLEKGLANLSAVAEKSKGKNMAAIKYGGTAGGAAAGLHAFVNAQLVSGIEYFLQLTRFDTALEKSDLVITGEGSIDDQTLQGKGPFGVARLAKQKKIPVIGLAGKIPDAPGESLLQYFDQLVSINKKNGEPHDLLAATEANLVSTSMNLGNELAAMQSK